MYEIDIKEYVSSAINSGLCNLILTIQTSATEFACDKVFWVVCEILMGPQGS